MSSTVLTPTRFAQTSVNISEQWPAAMLRTSSELVEVDKSLIFREIFSRFPDKNIKIDSNLRVNIESPSAASAFATYCTSSFWSENVRNSRGLMCYNVKINEVVVPIYSLRGEANAKLDKGMYSVDDVIQSSTMYLNNIVDDFYDHTKTWAMTPLARICITDSNIIALAEELNLEPNDIVKTINVGSARKSFQLYQTTKWCSLECTIACIMRTSFAANASQATKAIATRSIAKCVNRSGTGGVNTKKVTTILSFLSGQSSGMDVEVDSIMETARKMALNRTPKIAKTAETVTSFEKTAGVQSQKKK
ncbi:nucleoprotein [Neuropteran phasma-related virus OKIAV248]|uniref:Nucleoprotein n=1 Tax=Neuropteran phasma-related virus OKIAV248 TaxID=2789453 RepID=A0A7U3NUV1_9VIRU|nr:nucleoprotein [Neuropteran phasma-related virus OKIAV248]QPB73989.1 nucleoprotein [Neuropteran phasma-related virus OKIAV248]